MLVTHRERERERERERVSMGRKCKAVCEWRDGSAIPVI